MIEIEDLSDELMKKQIMEWDEFTLFVRSHLYLEYYLNLVIKNQLRGGKELVDDKNFTTHFTAAITTALFACANCGTTRSQISRA